MDKLWAGRFQKELDQTAAAMNASISIDCKMYREDILGSIAHAAMLGAQGIISQQDAATLIDGLQSISEDLANGSLEIDPKSEDIHSFVESTLIARVGEVGRRLHTARSRNDQVATDIKLYLREEISSLTASIRALLEALLEQATTHKDSIMPGYTHLQRAQPITFGHQLLAYAMMLMRDIGRLEDAAARMNTCPLGSGALAGVTFPIDREATAQELGFSGVTANSLDGVSDRDFCLELAAASAILMMHLSRFSEELILWSSWEFHFIELDDAFTTGSSMMPQKKNSDMAELVRGKTGRVYGDLIALLTMMKGLPLAYNKDMQEDKEAIFDSIETAKQALIVFAPMIATMKVYPESMRQAAAQGFINATDLADYLAKKGLPFRSAYKTVGEIVAHCIRKSTTLEALPLTEYQQFSDLFAEDLYADIDMEACVNKRSSEGGTAAASVEKQIQLVKDFLTK